MIDPTGRRDQAKSDNIRNLRYKNANPIFRRRRCEGRRYDITKNFGIATNPEYTPLTLTLNSLNRSFSNARPLFCGDCTHHERYDGHCPSQAIHEETSWQGSRCPHKSTSGSAPPYGSTAAWQARDRARVAARQGASVGPIPRRCLGALVPYSGNSHAWSTFMRIGSASV